MTVAELMKRLAELPPDAEVHVGYDYGDHVHTTATAEVEGAELCNVAEWYGVHRIVEGDEDVSRKSARPVVVIQ